MSDTISSSSDRTQIQQEITDHMGSVLELTQSILDSGVIITNNDDEAHLNLREFMSNTLSSLVYLNDHSIVMPSTLYMTKRMLARINTNSTEYQKLQEEADKQIDSCIDNYLKDSLSLVSLLNWALTSFSAKTTDDEKANILKCLEDIEESSKLLLSEEDNIDLHTSICCSDENKLNILFKYLDILEGVYVSAKNGIITLNSSSLSNSSKVSKLISLVIKEFSDIIGDSKDAFISISKIHKTVHAITNCEALTMTDGRIVVVDKTNNSVVGSYADITAFNKDYYIPE